MSGGVDSSAAAALLVQQGYDCDGAMLKLAPNEDSRCCSADDAEDARQAATRLGMRFYVFNETDRFRRCVMDRFTAEYAAGRTPNPCIDCNRELKFGALLDRALTLGYDYIATGHYARVAYDAESGRYRLLRGAERQEGPELCAVSADAAPAGPSAAAGGEAMTSRLSVTRRGRQGWTTPTRATARTSASCRTETM